MALVLPGAGQSTAIASDKSASPPVVSAKFTAPPETVFDTGDACELIDTPDAPARAWRDSANIVHLVTAHYVARARVGPNLNQLRRDCRVIYRSPHDPNPAHGLDENWLAASYTEDGRRIAALMHSEYHGDQYPGMCGDLTSPNHGQDCTSISITYAESRDGGLRFAEPVPPANLVAALPYPYDRNNRSGAHGYENPSNILKLGPWYYSLLNVRDAYRAQGYGPCLIRTANLFDPASWRGFDGSSFTTRFINPYTGPAADPARHVCFPIVPGMIESLGILEPGGTILGVAYTEDNRYGAGPGLYIMASHDLIHWSRASRVSSTGELLEADHHGNFRYLYFALLDPASTDRNFSTISRSPYVYYVRFDNDHPPYKRALLRRRIEITVQP